MTFQRAITRAGSFAFLLSPIAFNHSAKVHVSQLDRKAGAMMKRSGESDFEYGRRTGGTVLQNNTTASLAETSGQKHAVGYSGGGVGGGLGVLGLPLILLAIPFFAVIIFAGIVSVVTCLLIMLAANADGRTTKMDLGAAYLASLWGLSAATAISVGVVLFCIFLGRSFGPYPGVLKPLVDWAYTAFGAAAGLVVIIGTTAKDIEIEPGSLQRLVAATPLQATATFIALIAVPLAVHSWIVRSRLKPIGWAIAIGISAANIVAAWLVAPWLFVKFAPPQWTAFL